MNLAASRKFPRGEEDCVVVDSGSFLGLVTDLNLLLRHGSQSKFFALLSPQIRAVVGYSSERVWFVRFMHKFTN